MIVEVSGVLKLVTMSLILTDDYYNFLSMKIFSELKENSYCNCDKDNSTNNIFLGM